MRQAPHALDGPLEQDARRVVQTVVDFSRRPDVRAGVGIADVGAPAKVITAVALIMIGVFLGFVLCPDPVVKMIGIGLATAVAVDATIVRMVLLPARVALVGESDWWLPRWLDRILPLVDLEG